jgi:hypothetical protein
VDEGEARQLAAIPKLAEPAEWGQIRPHTHSNVFGVLNLDRQAIPGLHVDLEVLVTPRLGLERFVFTLFKVDFGVTERAYQIHINQGRHLRPTDHQYSHEHYGEKSLTASPDWAYATFDQTVCRFCQKINLQLTSGLEHYTRFSLK